MSAPVIPKRVSSLLSAPGREEVNSLLAKREFSASKVSLSSTTDEFLELKMDDFETSMECFDVVKKHLDIALEEGRVAREEYNKAVAEIDEQRYPYAKQHNALKRQRKTLKDDMKESEPHEKLEELYTSLMCRVVMSASGKQKKTTKNEQKHFHRACLTYYQALDEKPGFACCHLTGWDIKAYVKATHIVPKSLASEELAHFFGVGHVDLMQPRNALMLVDTLEIALDTGHIVIVPLPSEPNEPTRWKCVVTEKSTLGLPATKELKWKDVDGKELVFRGPNRPARRYLYFRFLITYLHYAKLGDVKWESEVSDKGTIWASPGNYLRESMLLTFAKKIGDIFLPSATVQQTTFSEGDGSPNRSKDEEETLVTALVHRVHDLKHSRAAADDDFFSDEDAEDETDSSDE